MLFKFLLLIPALVLGAPNYSGKDPTPYKYAYELKDTTGYASSFSILAIGANLSSGRYVQLRPLGKGEYIPVIDTTSPILQAQLEKGELQSVEYYPHGKKTATGLIAGLREISQDPKTKNATYDIIFSKKESKNEKGLHGWDLFDPAADGIYSLGQSVGHVADTFLFALCPSEKGDYSQLKFAQSDSHKIVNPPKGCDGIFLYATLAPPKGKPS